MDFAKLIIFQARTRQDEPAVAFVGGVATYGLLAKAVLAAADRIGAIGLPPGALVAVDMRNPFHHLVLLLALALRGHPSASLQTSLSVELSGLAPAAILVDGFAKQPDGLALLPVSDDWFMINPETPPDFGRLFALPGISDPNALVRVVFSSGTTGVPKSTGFTSVNMERRLAHAAFTHGGGAIGAIRALTPMGISTFPGYLMPIAALASGGVACFATQPGEILHITRMFSVDVLLVAVVQLQMLIQSLGSSSPPASLRTLVVGGSKLPPPLLAEARARICPNVLFGYGSTEAGSVASAPGAILAGLDDGAAGYVLPWATVEVVDDNDQPLPPGEEGILRLWSDEMGYYVVDQPENALLFRNGWFYPGDIGILRSDGLLVVTGRSAEIINRGGSIVAPDLVERVLTAHPGVAHAAVFGVPNRMGIEEIWAAVVANEPFDHEGILAYAREKLADKAPRVIRRVDDIPLTDSGKPLRRILREQLLA